MLQNETNGHNDPKTAPKVKKKMAEIAQKFYDLTKKWPQ